jgi:hypothetical protein
MLVKVALAMFVKRANHEYYQVKNRNHRRCNEPREVKRLIFGLDKGMEAGVRQLNPAIFNLCDGGS